MSRKHRILHSLSMFTVYVQCLPQVSAQAFSSFGNTTIACASFSLSIKRRASVMSAFFYLSKLCYFGNYQKILKQFIFLQIYVTYDIISSNPVLTILTLSRFSVQKFLNVRKSLVSHAKKCVISQLLKSIKFCLAYKCVIQC